MKNQKKIFLTLAVIAISILISTLIWNYIKLPYVDNEIVGNYSSSLYNSKNDLLRYLFFIFFPIINFLLFKILIEKHSLKLSFANFKDDKIINFSNNIFSIYLLIIFILFLFLEFLSINFPTQFLDVFHEGQRLSSSYRSSLDNSLWKGSYITVGVFYEIISPKLAWGIFKNISIGSSRFFDLFLVFSTKVLLTIFAFQISKFSQLNPFYKNIFFLILFLIFNKLCDYNISSVDLLSFREIPIIFLSIIFIESIVKKRFSNFLVVLFGFISILSLFWGIDRGIISNLLIILIFAYFIISKNYLKVYLITLSTSVAWILSWLILGDEFNYFVSNSYYILSEISSIHGIIHPTPFSDEQNAGRATKNLISIIIILLISINFFFSKNRKISYQFKILLLAISIISFFNYFNAVGRTDGPHLRSVFGFPIIFFSVYFIFLILRFLDEFTKKYKFKNNKTNFLFVGLVIIINFIFIDINSNKILDFKNRLNNFIKLDDKNFVNAEYYEFINKSKAIISEEDCVQLFTNDAALLYLLRKKNCTKYYFVWSVGSVKLQKRFVEELKNTIFIIDDNSAGLDNYSPYNKLPIVSSFIQSNYELFYTSDKFRILKLK